MLRDNPKLLSEILRDKANWRSGVVGKPHLIPSRKLKNGRWTKKRTVKLTDEAQSAVTSLSKDFHATPYFAQANLNRTGIIPENKVIPDIFNKLYGSNISKSAAAKLTGNKAVLDDIIRYEKLDPNKLKIMKLKDHQLNGLHRDTQYSNQFRKMSEITHGRKFNNKDELMGYLVSNGFNPGQVKKVGNYVMINYSPQWKTNFYTGGINARVLLKPSDPGKAHLIPNDVYDIFSPGFDKLVRGGLGFKNQNLNIMGIKKIDIPDPSNWGKSFKGVERKIAATVKRNTKKAKNERSAIKSVKKKYKKSVEQTDNQLVYQNTRLNKNQLDANDTIIKELDNITVPFSRKAKLGAAYTAVGAGLWGAGSILSDD